MKMKLLVSALLTIALVATAYASSAVFQHDGAQRAFERYDQQMTRAENDYAQAVERATAQYRQALEGALAGAKRTGTSEEVREIEEALGSLPAARENRMGQMVTKHRWMIVHPRGEMPLTFLENGTVQTGKSSIWQRWEQVNGNIVLHGSGGEVSVFQPTHIPLLVSESADAHLSMLVPALHQK